MWFHDFADIMTFRFRFRPTNWPLLTVESPVAQWIEYLTRSQRAMGSNPIWHLDFFSKFSLHLKCLYGQQGFYSFW